MGIFVVMDSAEEARIIRELSVLFRACDEHLPPRSLKTNSPMVGYECNPYIDYTPRAANDDPFEP